MTRPYFDPVLSGRKMRSIRKSRNITVEQVRDYMGFESVQSIYKWERGECFPQADTLIALSLLYQVNPVELFEEDAEASSFHFAEKVGQGDCPACLIFRAVQLHYNKMLCAQLHGIPRRYASRHSRCACSCRIYT